MKMEPKTIGLGIGLVVILLYLAGFPPNVDAGAPRLITVLGEAEVRVVPDEVIITMAVETDDPVLTVAKEANDARVREIIGLAAEFGVGAQEIQTGQLSIEPRYRDSYEKKEFIAYFVRKRITVHLKDLSKYEDLLSSLLAAGVNYIEGIQFQCSDLERYQKQAQAEAVQAAQAKAVRLAAELGREIGAPHLIQEEGTDFYPVGAKRYTALQDFGLGPETASTLAPGVLSVRSAFTVSFALE